MNRWLWVLWGAMILSMLLKRQADTYMVIALIILPILIVLFDLHEEIAVLKEENKHQRKFVMDRYNILQDKMKDVSSQIEKRLVVDFAEFTKSNPAAETSERSTATIEASFSNTGRKKKRRKKPVQQTAPAIEFAEIDPESLDESEDFPSSDDEFEDI